MGVILYYSTPGEKSFAFFFISAKAQWFAHGDVGQEVRRENRVASEAEPKMLQCFLWSYGIHFGAVTIICFLPMGKTSPDKCTISESRNSKGAQVLMFFCLHFAGRTKRSDVLFGTYAWMTPQESLMSRLKIFQRKQCDWLYYFWSLNLTPGPVFCLL